MKTVVDTSKLGTKGYPTHWRELGFTPPLEEVNDDDPRPAYDARDLRRTYVPPCATGAAAKVPCGEDVILERERRLCAGFTYNFGDSRGAHLFATTAADMAGWDEVQRAATAAASLGLLNESIDIVTNTGPVTVSFEEWALIVRAATAFRQPIWRASFRLLATNPVPADFADDRYWSD